MTVRHPEGELVAYLRGELGASDRERVGAHLGSCGECRDRVAAFDGVVMELERSLPEPPEIHWGRYRAELRARLDGATSESPGLGAHSAAPDRAFAWLWGRPLPLALSAVLAGTLLVLAITGLPRQRAAEAPLAFEESVIGDQLELLRTYPIVERLDLLENLDVIKQLDRLAPSRES